jgi:hypothetical protein
MTGASSWAAPRSGSDSASSPSEPAFGVDHPVRTWDARRVSTDLQTGRGPPATESLLERDAQLALLHELLEDAASGQGVAVLHARGHELERAFGWGVARSLLETSLGDAAAAEVAARSLARSVLRRLAALSPDARALVRGVAVFEDDAPLHLAAELTGLAAVAALAAADELAQPA